MREIKFRAWDGSMMLHDVIPLGTKTIIAQNGYNTVDQTHSGWAIETDIWNYADFIFMQYTGLKDKNGKEIYEGDIIQTKDWHTDENGRCVLSEANSYMKKTIVEYTTKHPFIGFTFHDKCEIIGNVWENPELIEK